MAEVKLPYPFPQTVHELFQNQEALREFVADVDARLETFTGLKTGILDATGNVTLNSTSGTTVIDGATTIDANLTNTDRLVTDTDGNVVTVNQPLFRARITALSLAADEYTGAASPLDFDDELLDVAGNYNNSTYTFTAPVDGKYLFSYRVVVQPRAGTPATFFRAYLSTTGGPIGGDYVANLTTSDIITLQQTIVVDMDANDTAKVIVFPNSTTSTWQRPVEPSYSGGGLGIGANNTTAAFFEGRLLG